MSLARTTPRDRVERTVNDEDGGLAGLGARSAEQVDVVGRDAHGGLVAVGREGGLCGHVGPGKGVVGSLLLVVEVDEPEVALGERI